MTTQIQQAVSLLRLHFLLPEEELVLDALSSDLLEQSLEKIINYLLNNDLNRLLNALYKIDINENRFKEILTISPPQEVAIVLTREIIQRELKKVETRAKYKNF